MNNITNPPTVIVYHDEGVSHYTSMSEYINTIIQPIQPKVCIIETPPKSDTAETTTGTVPPTETTPSNTQ